MRHYCSLSVRSDREGESETLFVPAVLSSLEFEDMHSPARLAQSARWRSMDLISRSDLPRYSWSLDTRNSVGTAETDPFVHVDWLISQLRPSIELQSERRRGVEFGLSFYWGGGGTGGGPFISPALVELLARHQLGLDVGFYFERDEHAV